MIEQITELHTPPQSTEFISILPAGVRAITRYQTEDGEVHDTIQAALDHRRDIAAKAWGERVNHVLMRLLYPGPISDYMTTASVANVVRHFGLVLTQNNEEIAKLLMEKPK